METLPPVWRLDRRVALPLCESTAEALAAALLETDAACRAGILTAALRSDPALVLWAIHCAGPSRTSSTPPTLSELAQELAAHLNAWLRWPDEQSSDDVSAAAMNVDTYVELVARDVAAAQASVEPPTDVIHSVDYVARILQNGDDWFQTASDARPLNGAASGRVAQLLPKLTQRLSRLDSLESRFDLAVEEEKLHAMYKLAAGAGHEINNPLGSIAGRAQLLLRDEKDPERRRTLAKINAQAFRAHEMISDLMLFARPPAPAREEVDLVTLLDEVLAGLREAAGERHIELSRGPVDAPLLVLADGAQLRVALRAMCVNALEAVGGGGHVEVFARRVTGENGTAATHAPAAEIVIRDDGPGISPEVRRHLFDPFYSGREAGRGLGFGLSKCWRIVKNHGGQIDVESTPGHGARFTITLPA